MSKPRILSEEQIKIVLQEQYKCKYVGKTCPPPYASEDDMPTFYLTPSGHTFCIPADDGAGYGPETFDRIVKSAKLDVVVGMDSTARATKTDI